MQQTGLASIANTVDIRLKEQGLFLGAEEMIN